MQTTETVKTKPLEPALAHDLLGRVNTFFSDMSYVEKGRDLRSHQTEDGIVPTVNRWGNHTHGIGEGSMELPTGVAWNDLIQAGVVDRYTGMLRVDLVRDAASKTA